MKKHFPFLALVLFSTLALAQNSPSPAISPSPAAPRSSPLLLKAKGKVIVDGTGKTFILRGMGLGGWMLQEGYMFRLGAIGQQHRIKQKIEELVGSEKTTQFYNTWLNQHTTKKDIDSMAAWGFNSIRLPMHYQLYTLPVEAEPIAGQNTWLQKGFDMTDSLLSWCRANNMYLILDLHAAPGGQGNDLNISDRDPAKPSLWESEANQQKTIALWRRLAQRYAGDPAIGGYDIINEPNWGFEDPKDIRGTKEKSNKPLRTLMMQITAAIREVDPTHMIIIEGNGFGNNYNGIFPLWDDNIVLSFHKYGNFNTETSIQNFLDWQNKYNVPLWLGESGENSNTWFTGAIQLVETRNIGWCWWQLKKMGINNPLEIKITPSYQMLLNYWLRNGPKPTPAEAEAALDEWLENIRIQNNIYHKDVTDAMFRQVASSGTIPFIHHLITDGTIINAIDYDLGRNGSAYLDNDTARYQYVTPPIASAGNRGSSYRNDGVDIQPSSTNPPSSATEAGSPESPIQTNPPNSSVQINPPNSSSQANSANSSIQANSLTSSLQSNFPKYHIFNIEDGEWLQYTVTVVDPGTYTISITTSAPSSGGMLSLLCNGKPLGENIPVPDTDDTGNWKNIQLKNISLQKGPVQFRIVANKGGFKLSRMQFVRMAQP